MFRRDRTIARNDKRRQDGIYVKILTCQLAELLPDTDTILEYQQTRDKQLAKQPDQSPDPQDVTTARRVVATAHADKNTVRKAKSYGPT